MSIPLSERVNPLVIKELRQGVRSRALWGAFAVLLAVCVCIAGAAYLSFLTSKESLNGEAYFGAFFACACFIYLFVIPSRAYQSLLQEQDGETWPLLTLTGMGARRILKGKVASALVMAGLYTCVVFPFLLFAYFLNGIELSTILLFMAGTLALMVFLTFSAVCWASFARTRMERAFLRGAVVLGTLWTASSVAGLWFGWKSRGLVLDVEVARIGVTVLWTMISLSYLFYETAVARMSLDSEDFSQGPRRALGMQLLGFWAILFWWKTDGFIGALALNVLIAVCAIFLVTDRDGIPRRLRGRTGWDLLLPGAVRGFRFVWLLLAVNGAVGALLVPKGSPNDSGRYLLIVFAVPAYVVAYLALALVLGHRLRIGNVSSHFRTRLFTAFLFVVGGLFPVVAQEIDRRFYPWLGLLSPISGPTAFELLPNHRTLFGLLVGVSAMLLAIADRVLLQDERRVSSVSGTG